ncbi:hypothetical protein [Desulfatibacillum aliphaticivorans]|uniref:hypothetical protein n=1 Tax=Desulfatibacillum aliphaticivorans TaxID=218208 RepID=UPI00041608C6|nr:hypothetical protein [Desulfatibacillum aliphaticivorans]
MPRHNYINVRAEAIHGMLELVGTEIMPIVNPLYPEFNRLSAHRTITMILSNMFKQWCRGQELEISLSNSAYTNEKIIRMPVWYRPSYVSRCLKDLEKTGWVIFERRHQRKNRLSSLAHPQPILIFKIFEQIQFAPPVFDRDLVVLREAKQKISYMDGCTLYTKTEVVQGQKIILVSSNPYVAKNCKYITENRHFLEELYKFLSGFLITAALVHKTPKWIREVAYNHLNGRISSGIKSPKALGDAIMAKPLNWRFRIRDVRMFRSFNVDFQHGGRFYGAVHENLKKDIRKTIQIDSQDTVELDYSGLHLRMLYHLKGMDYKQDPYDIPDIDRTLVKKAAMMLINAKGEGSAKKAVLQYLLTKEDDEGNEYRVKDPEGVNSKLADKVIACLKQKHPLIANDFFTGIGLELQFRDSEIMKGILEESMQKNMPCLPIHDSVICKQSHQEEVRRIMIEQYRSRIHFDPVV